MAYGRRAAAAWHRASAGRDSDRQAAWAGNREETNTVKGNWDSIRTTQAI